MSTATTTTYIGQTIQDALFGIVNSLINVGVAIMNAVAGALQWAAENIVPVLVTVSLLGAAVAGVSRILGFDVFGVVRSLVGNIVGALT